MAKVRVPQRLDPIVITQPDGSSKAYAVKGGFTNVADADLAAFLWAIPEASASGSDVTAADAPQAEKPDSIKPAE